jgi:hypothetical protein
MEVRNAVLRDAVHGLLKEFMALLRTLPEDVAAIRSKTFHLSGPTYAFEQYGLINEVRRILDAHFPVVREWPQYSALRKLIQGGFPYENSMIGDDEMGLLDRSYLPSLIRFFLAVNSFALDFSESAFNRMYEMLENGLYADSIKFWVRAPIHGIEVEGEWVADDLILRDIDKDDFENLVLSLDVSSFIRSPSNPLLKSVGIVEQTIVRKSGAATPSSPVTIMRRFATVLSILVKGKVMVGAATSIPKDHWTFLSGTTYGYVPDENPYMPGLVSLKATEHDALRALWEAYLKATVGNPWLDLSLERLHRSFFTIVPEEKIVDLVTVLEILYSHESTSELRYKLSISPDFSYAHMKKPFALV